MNVHGDEYKYLYKIILIGDTGVGKTFLVNRFIKGKIPEDNMPTIGVEFEKKTVELASGGKIRVQIWDTAGQERYRAICSNHYHDAAGALLVYDITKEHSFFSCQKWLEEFKINSEVHSKVMLVGNKRDIVERNPEVRRVSFEDAKKFADLNNVYFMETSAVTDENVSEAFLSLLQEIFYEKNAKGPEDKIKGFKVGKEFPSSKMNDGCC